MTMAQEVSNFARFYATFNKIPYSGDREDLKKEMVEKVTLGRTSSLREVTKREYQDLCEGLEKIYPANRINAFCQDGRIAGKQFRDITSEELEQLAKKLRSIERKGGIRELEEPGPKAIVVPFK